jgi:hypothetical protein
MAAIPFLKTENEADASKAGAFFACVLVTFGLAYVSIYGVWKVPGDAWGKAGYTLAVLGAECLAAFALMRAMLAPTVLRKVAAFIVFIGLAWYCVHNVERGVHQMYPSMFASDAKELRDKAALALEQAGQFQQGADAAREASGSELALVRTRIAELKAEQQLMASQSPEKIKEAQALLIASGKYFGRVDGIRQTLTEAAMRARGEEIARELIVLNEREAGMASGAPAPQQTVVADARTSQIELEADARARAYEGLLLTIGLWVLEAARSVGLVVFVSGITATGTVGLDRLREDIERAKLQTQLKNVLADEPPEPVERPYRPAPEPEPLPKPPEPEIEPEPPPPPPPPALTPTQQRARNAGLASSHARELRRDPIKIPVGDHALRDGLLPPNADEVEEAA